MSGKSNTKWLETMVKRLGSKEAVSKFMSERGSRGGQVSCPKGFASMPTEKVAAAGRIGGTRSKRVKRTKL